MTTAVFSAAFPPCFFLSPSFLTCPPGALVCSLVPYTCDSSLIISDPLPAFPAAPHLQLVAQPILLLPLPCLKLPSCLDSVSVCLQWQWKYHVNMLNAALNLVETLSNWLFCAKECIPIALLNTEYIHMYE